MVKNRLPKTPASAAILILLCAVVFMAGCSTSTMKEEVHSSQTPLIWPSPPEPARISYYMSIETPMDIGANKGFFRKIAELLLGPKNDAIIKPYGITIDSKDRIIVADTALKRVHIYDTAKKKYSYIEDAGEVPLLSPIAVAVDADDNIFVTDSLSPAVYAFNHKGDFLFDIQGLGRPTGIAVDKKAARLYISDTRRNTVEVYDLKGKKIKTIGEVGEEPGQFNFPVDLFVDVNGDLYVVDSMNYRIQIFGPDGNFQTMFGGHGDGTGDFGRPKGVSVDSDGNIYVADAIFDTIQIFDRKDNFLLNFGSLGRQIGSFWVPSGMFIDKANKVYVADSYNKRIQIFDYLGHG